MLMVISYLLNDGFINLKIAQDELKLRADQYYRIINRLKELGLAKSEGRTVVPTDKLYKLFRMVKE